MATQTVVKQTKLASSIIPTTWYDASNDTDPADSLAIGGGLTLMCGATVISTCGKLLHVGNAGSSHTEYMQLERSTRSILWLRQLLQTMQIFRSSGHVASSGNFVRSTRLYNSTPSYIDSITGRVLRWITQHDSGEPPTWSTSACRQHQSGWRRVGYHQRAWHRRHHCFHTCTNGTWTARTRRYQHLADTWSIWRRLRQREDSSLRRHRRCIDRFNTITPHR